MVGLSEREDEVIELMHDLRRVKCNTPNHWTIPTTNQRRNLDVQEYITPELFAKYKEIGLKMGFDQVESGALVRSSYMAEETFIESKLGK